MAWKHSSAEAPFCLKLFRRGNEFADMADGSKSHGMHFSRDAWCYFDVNADKELTSLTCSGLRLTLTQGVISLSPALVTSSSEK